MKVPDLTVKKTFYCGVGDPSLVLGKGPLQTRGGFFAEGPAIIGSIPPFLTATLMVGPCENSDMIKVGSNVIHDRFGKGKVTKMEGSGADKKATIFFPHHGAKTVLLSFANLTILDEE